MLADARTYGRAFEAGELRDLRRFFGGARRIRAWLAERAEAAPACARLAEGWPDFAALEERVDGVVDERGDVVDGASPRLGPLRREIAKLERRSEELVAELARTPKVRSLLTDGQVHRRSGRPTLAVRARSAGRVRGIVHDHSQSGETAFVEPAAAVELGNCLAKVREDERREVALVLSELTRELLGHEDEVRAAAERLAELELAWIGAEFCRTYEARVPRVAGDEGAAEELVLRGARHPLLCEQVAQGRLDEVVPIDLRLGRDFDLLIVTGPNTGGKTLALKTAGLAALLARLGLPFPCESGTTVPLYEGIAADIGDEQEVDQNLSTFASHLARIRAGLERAGPRTLFLLDELGGGTDPDEGAALGEALLAHLLARAVPTLVTTHLGRLKEFAFRHARVENACAEFDVASLRPLYRLLVGTPGESCALAVAERMRLPAELVRDAAARVERRGEEQRQLLDDLRRVREDAERLRSEAEQRVEDLEERDRSLGADRARLEERRETLEAEAQRGLEERTRDARGVVERAQALLPQVGGPAARQLGELLAELDRTLTGASLTERRQAFLRELRKGVYVWLPRYKKRCVVSRVDRQRQQVRVRLGAMTVEVPFDDVTWYENL